MEIGFVTTSGALEALEELACCSAIRAKKMMAPRLVQDDFD
jgi:hypothetical protein